MGSFCVNCLLVVDEVTSCAVLVDPGDDANKLVAEIRKRKLTLTHILLTHAHLDHIMGVAQVKKAFSCTIWLHKNDEPLFVNTSGQAEALGIKWKDNLPTVDCYFEDQDILTCGSMNIRVIHTPGHSAGSVCFEFFPSPLKGEGILITGDTLFAGSVGRTDLWGGNEHQLKQSLKKLNKYPADTRVIPGHGPETTIGEEKETGFLLAH